MNNYHTHTYRCKHADGDVADYVAAARTAGLAELGFSDHCPHPDGRWPENHMDMADLPSYMEALAAFGAPGAAHAGVGEGPPILAGPLVLAGLECEWVPEYLSFMRDEFLGRLNLDYLVAGIHCYLHRGEWKDSYSISSAAELASFAESSCRALDCGLFSFLAHPDVFCYSWLSWDANAISCARDILSTSARTGIPVEINGYGMRKGLVHAKEGLRRPYPQVEFWELAAEYGVSCVVNSDAHRPVDTAANLVEGRAIAEQNGLRLIEGLPLPVGPARLGT